jgi:hypothetical protein
MLRKDLKAGELAARLTAFYFEHCPSMIDNVGEVSRKFAGRQQELNDALLRKYKCDLNSFAAKQGPSAPTVVVPPQEVDRA